MGSSFQFEWAFSAQRSPQRRAAAIGADSTATSAGAGEREMRSIEDYAGEGEEEEGEGRFQGRQGGENRAHSERAPMC